jgi:UDP-N-acetylglucosamine--N-acetylmuramyl-(pentapeptide) pyrophosphoryl-undecaprenol N-acetylglucosamine transferase
VGVTSATNIRVHGFINRMDLAYAAADIIVSRAGAGTISELCIVGKPVILVPSPNVAEDHQTHNAQALEERNAAVRVPDNLAVEMLVGETLDLLADQVKRKTLSENISSMADRDADSRIAREIIKLMGR